MNTRPRRLGILWKLFAGYALIILVATLTIGIVASRRITRDAIEEVRRFLEIRALLLERVLDGFSAQLDDPRLQERIRDLGKRIETRITIIRADGIVAADSEVDPQRLDNHLSRPEVADALAAGDGLSTRFSGSVSAQMMYRALPIRDGDGELLGLIRVATPLRTVDERLASLRESVFLSAAIAALAALVVGFLVARRITAPLVHITDAAEAIASGDYRKRVSTVSRDEIGKLAGAFNAMASQLEERVVTMTSDHDTLSAILGGLVEGIVAVDSDNRIVHINAVAGNLLGVGPVWAVGRPCHEAIRDRVIADTLSDVLEDGEDADLEIILERPGGDVTMELHAAPMRARGGDRIGAVAFFHDVTELRHLEGVRRDFVANVSHELKTPITAIRGIAETLADDAEMSPDVRHSFVDKVARQSERLSSLVSDLLTLARLESSAGIPTERLVDLTDLAGDCVAASQSLAEDQGIALEMELPSTPVRLRGDEQSLRQLVSNLLVNAVKYTPRGGSVWLRLRLEGNDIRIEVEDTGIGIEPQHLPRIFERFYRVDRARSRELGGTGLGLSIVKHVCLAHGGDVRVDSTPGKGSTFRVTLPAGRG